MTHRGRSTCRWLTSCAPLLSAATSRQTAPYRANHGSCKTTASPARRRERQCAYLPMRAWSTLSRAAAFTSQSGRYTMAAEPDDVEVAALRNERLIVLGSVTERSAIMEWMLRIAFCALVESKYAAVLAGGRSINDLIHDCHALLKVHPEIPEQKRDALRAALHQ